MPLGLVNNICFSRPRGVVTPTPFIGPLDFITNTRLGAWSIAYKLFSNFNGSAISVRKDDAFQAEISPGFTPEGVCDFDALDLYLDGYDGYIARVNDQSGGEKHFENTPSFQPAYGQNWSAGPINRSMDFAGAQGLISDQVLPSATTWWGYIVSIPTGGVGTELWAIESYPDATTTYKLLERAFGVKPIYYNNAGGGSAQIAYVDNTAYTHLIKGGVALRYLKSSTGDVINEIANNSLAGNLSTIGYRNDSSAYFTGSIQEWALFEGELDSETEEALWADINNRWGIQYSGGGGGVGFAPTDIAGCQLWLKGDGSAYNTGSTQATDGQTVETWIDNSGQGNHSIQSTGIRRPVFKDISGIKSLLTSGSQWMDTTWNAGSTCSIFVVYKNSGTSNGRWVSGGNNWLLGPYSFNYSYYSNTGFAGGSTSSNGNTSIRLHNAVQTSGGGQHWLNGVSQGTVGSAGAPGIISAPGTYLSGGELGSGHIYEVIGYDSALSESDRQLVENYLLTKYGI